jgi:uncharacterized protein (DUF2267 family)
MPSPSDASVDSVQAFCGHRAEHVTRFVLAVLRETTASDALKETVATEIRKELSRAWSHGYQTALAVVLASMEPGGPAHE